MAKPRTKKSNKHTLQRLVRIKLHLAVLLFIFIAVAIGLYMQANRSNAAGAPFSSNVIIHIPGNNSNPALGSCTWSCFKPEVTQVSVYIVPIACVSQSNQQARDWCTDITSATLTSCHTYSVQSGDQDIPAGTMSFTPYGPNAGQNVGQIYYSLYAAAGSSCGSTYTAGVGGTPQTPTKYIGVLPNCGTDLGEACPIDESTPSSPQDPSNPNFSGPPGSGPFGLGPSGSGSTGSGPSGGSGGSTANKQSNQTNSLPNSSSQGEQKQTQVEPSPFFDGRAYVPGSTITEPNAFATVNSALSMGWLYVIVFTAFMASIAAAVYFWQRKRKVRK